MSLEPVSQRCQRTFRALIEAQHAVLTRHAAAALPERAELEQTYLQAKFEYEEAMDELFKPVHHNTNGGAE